MSRASYPYLMIIAFVLNFGAGCSSDTETVPKPDNTKDKAVAVDLTTLIGRSRSEMQKQFGQPNEPNSDVESFASPGILVVYDDKEIVKKASTEVKENPKVALLGGRIGDGVDKLVQLWGEPISKDNHWGDGYSRLRWIHRGFRIDVMVAKSSETKNNDGVPDTPNTALFFEVRRPDRATNLPFPDGAKEVLTKTLDCWVLGDSLSDFKAKHEDIDVVELGVSNWSDGNVLQRYEIGPFRTLRKEDIEVKQIVDFAVTLVFQSKAGTEIKNAVRINVSDMTDYFETRGYKVHLKPK